MGGRDKRYPKYLAYLAGEVISVRIMPMRHIRKIIFFFYKPDSFVYKFIQIIPKRFFGTIGISATTYSYNPGFFIYCFNFFFVRRRNSFINNSSCKQIYLTNLWVF